MFGIHPIDSQHIMPTFEEFRGDEQKVLAEAMEVARSYCDAEPLSSRMCPFQGAFSCTAIVTLSDKTEVSPPVDSFYPSRP
jgi:hypothetical protein